jgi:hypothetical protein
MESLTQIKNRLKTPHKSVKRSGGCNTSAAVGRKALCAKNMPPTQIKAANKCNTMRIAIDMINSRLDVLQSTLHLLSATKKGLFRDPLNLHLMWLFGVYTGVDN